MSQRVLAKRRLAPLPKASVLLNPGPVNTSERVKNALVSQELCHREPEYSDVLVELMGKLRRVFRGSEEHEVLLLTGSGTAGMEAALGSCARPNGKLLVVDNGAFGERLAEMARFFELPF